MITTKLQTTARRWFDLPVPAAAGITIFCLYLIAGLVWQLRGTPSVAPLPTPALAFATPLPVIVIQKEVAPTAAPTLVPTVDPLRQEVEQLRARVAELEQAQQAQPAPIIYVQEPAPAVDTPEPYTVASEPPPACASERQCAIQGRLANEHVQP